ncbi:MAG: hypothetical protein JKY37_11420 [Nannocystaceae bacterium]|nr:hypothetical protein [Nannocystaceae bacterium]
MIDSSKLDVVVAAIVLLAATTACSSSDDGAAADTDATDTSATDTNATDTSATTPDISSSDAGEDTGSSGEAADSSTDGGPPVSGELLVLSYNIAGLPQGISSSDPERYIPQISPLLNAYELVLAQEDFWYHDVLLTDIEHPNLSDPSPANPAEMGIGDGLNRFSQTPFGELERQQWYACHGMLDCASDCLGRKGWSFARHTLADGVEVDVYNLHMEAGGCPEDIEIRTQATLNLAAAIAERSDGRALVVAGDFNLRATDPEDVTPLENIINGAGLTDVCDALDCGDERIDHIMVRSGTSVTLDPLMWWVPEEFVDARTGDPLSDHLPVAARLSWSG